MSQKFKIVSLLCVWLFLSSCASQSILARFDNPDTGYIVIGLRVLKARELNALEAELSLVRSNVIGLSKYDHGRVVFCRGPYCESATYSDDKYAGLVVVRKLPVGNYTLNNISVHLRETDGFGLSRDSTGFGLFDLGAEIKDYKFQVKAGETSYIGNIALNELVKPGELLSNDRRAKVTITDRESRDFEYAMEKLPTVSRVLTNYFNQHTRHAGKNIVLRKQRRTIKHVPQLKSDVTPKSSENCNWGCW